MDDEAVETWKEYILIKSLKNPLNRKEKFLAIRKKNSMNTSFPYLKMTFPVKNQRISISDTFLLNK